MSAGLWVPTSGRRSGESTFKSAELSARVRAEGRSEEEEEGEMPAVGEPLPPAEGEAPPPVDPGPEEAERGGLNMEARPPELLRRGEAPSSAPCAPV